MRKFKEDKEKQETEGKEQVDVDMDKTPPRGSAQLDGDETPPRTAAADGGRTLGDSVASAEASGSKPTGEWSDEALKAAQPAKKRKSRWDQTADGAVEGVASTKKAFTVGSDAGNSAVRSIIGHQLSLPSDPVSWGRH